MRRASSPAPTREAASRSTPPAASADDEQTGTSKLFDVFRRNYIPTGSLLGLSASCALQLLMSAVEEMYAAQSA